MDSITSLPSQAYDYVYGNYGTVGLIIVGVAAVVMLVAIATWFDRRK